MIIEYFYTHYAGYQSYIIRAKIDTSSPVYLSNDNDFVQIKDYINDDDYFGEREQILSYHRHYKNIKQETLSHLQKIKNDVELEIERLLNETETLRR